MQFINNTFVKKFYLALLHLAAISLIRCHLLFTSRKLACLTIEPEMINFFSCKFAYQHKSSYFITLQAIFFPFDVSFACVLWR